MPHNTMLEQAYDTLHQQRNTGTRAT